MSYTRLNLNCKLYKKGNYINIDSNKLYDPDLVDDCILLPSFSDRSVEEICANDILTYVSLDQLNTAFARWNEILIEGGALDFQLPNLISLYSIFTKKEANFAVQGAFFDTVSSLLTEYLDRCGFRFECLSKKESPYFSCRAVKIFDFIKPLAFRLSDNARFLSVLLDSMGNSSFSKESRKVFLDFLDEGGSREKLGIFLKESLNKASKRKKG